MTKELLQLIPDHERATGNKVIYEKELASIEEMKMKGDDGSEKVAVSNLVRILET